MKTEKTEANLERRLIDPYEYSDQAKKQIQCRKDSSTKIRSQLIGRSTQLSYIFKTLIGEGNSSVPLNEERNLVVVVDGYQLISDKEAELISSDFYQLAICRA